MEWEMGPKGGEIGAKDIVGAVKDLQRTFHACMHLDRFFVFTYLPRFPSVVGIYLFFVCR